MKTIGRITLWPIEGYEEYVSTTRQGEWKFYTMDCVCKGAILRTRLAEEVRNPLDGFRFKAFKKV